MHVLHVVAIGCMVLWLKLFFYASYDILSSLRPRRQNIENVKLVNWTVHDYGTGAHYDDDCDLALGEEYGDNGV